MSENIEKDDGSLNLTTLSIIRIKLISITIFLLLLALYVSFSEIKENTRVDLYKLKGGETQYTELLNPIIEEAKVFYPCNNLAEMYLLLGSEYNTKDNKKINLQKSKCGKEYVLQLPENSYAEYIKFESNTENLVEISIKSKINREIKPVRYLILVFAFILYLLMLNLFNAKNKRSIRVKNSDIEKRKNIFFSVPILISVIINFLYVIPIWDDGWYLAIIKNYEDYGISSNLWARYNGIFGNPIYLLLGFLDSTNHEMLIIRIITCSIWITQYVLVLKIARQYYPRVINFETRIITSLVFALAILTMGSTLRFEPLIGLFSLLAFKYLLEFENSRSITAFIKMMLFIVLSLNLGLAGISALAIFVTFIYKNYKYIAKNLFILSNIILNSGILMVILFLFNSNLKIFEKDLSVIRVFSPYSHNYGVFDEWRRYLGAQGIFNSYDISFQILSIMLLTTFVYGLIPIKSAGNIKDTTNLTFILMVLFLSLTPSKWGWYVIPLIPLLSLRLINTPKESFKIKGTVGFAVISIVLLKLVNNSIWKPNPSLNTESVNEFLTRVNNYTNIIIFTIIFLFILLLIQKTKGINKNYILSLSLLLVFTFNIFGITGVLALNKDSSAQNEQYFWKNNSVKSCSFISKVKYNELKGEVERNRFILNGNEFFPIDKSQVFLDKIKRYTFNDASNQRITLTVDNRGVTDNFMLAIRGRDIPLIDIRYGKDKSDSPDLVNASIKKNISDSTTWQLVDLGVNSNALTSVEITSKELVSDLQITEPFYVESVSLLRYLKQSSQYLHLGPQELFLGDCLNSPKIEAGKWVFPDLVIGNANYLSGIFSDQERLRLIDNCWVNSENAKIDDCIVNWYRQ